MVVPGVLGHHPAYGTPMRKIFDRCQTSSALGPKPETQMSAGVSGRLQIPARSTR